MKTTDAQTLQFNPYINDHKTLEKIILDEIRTQVPNGSKFIDIIVNDKYIKIKLDGSFYINELTNILNTVKQYSKD